VSLALIKKKKAHDVLQALLFTVGFSTLIYFERWVRLIVVVGVGWPKSLPR
jgi:hypothetical protein